MRKLASVGKGVVGNCYLVSPKMMQCSQRQTKMRAAHVNVFRQVTIPENGQSFALIYSIEDPLGNTQQAGVGLQVMGPDDGYICQFDKDVKSFWASRNSLELGATFKAAPGAGGRLPQSMVSEVGACGVSGKCSEGTSIPGPWL